jgi:hypothetical protein
MRGKISYGLEAIGVKYYKQFVCDKCGRFFKRRIPGYNPITTTVASKLISSSSK